MKGYLGMMMQFIDPSEHELVNNALAMRFVPKGETGHTIERIHSEIVAELTELATLVNTVRATVFMFFIYSTEKFYCRRTLQY